MSFELSFLAEHRVATIITHKSEQVRKIMPAEFLATNFNALLSHWAYLEEDNVYYSLRFGQYGIRELLPMCNTISRTQNFHLPMSCQNATLIFCNMDTNVGKNKHYG